MTDQEFTHEARGRNPVLPSWLHLPDPEAHVMPDGRPYVYGSPITFNDDGTIDEVVMTSIGAGDPFGLDERIDEDVRIRVMTLT